MAYNKGYNPDALPAHAEPEQAAQLLTQSQTAAAAAGSRPPRSSSRPDYNKPPPPAPSVASSSNLRPSYAAASGDDRYGRQSPSGYSSGSGGGGYDDRRRYDDDRRHSPRYGGSAQDWPGSPPPSGYGQGPPPANYHGRPPPASRPPATPAPPRDANDRDALWRLFGAVDKDRSGYLSEKELRAALVNGDWSSFDPHTVRMMIRMFDTDRSGTINFDEFCGLWSFLAAWRTLFDRFDLDRSGNIQYDEFSEALVAFGYRLSPQFVKLLFRTYDKSGRNAIGFDMFVQACISLKRMTDVFKKYDEDRDGYITLSFEEFLTEIIIQRDG